MKSIATTSSSKSIMKRKTGFGMGFFKTHSPILKKNKKSILSNHLQKNSSTNINISNNIINGNAFLNSNGYSANPLKIINKAKKTTLVTFASPPRLTSDIKDKKPSIKDSPKFLIPIHKSGIKKKNDVSHWNQRETLKALIRASKKNNPFNLSEDEIDKRIANIEIKTKELFKIKSEIFQCKSKIKSKTKSKTKSTLEHGHHHHRHHLTNNSKLFRLQQQQATPLSSDDSVRRESMPSLSKTSLTSPFNSLPSPFQMTPSPSNMSRYHVSSTLYNSHFGSNNNTLTPSEPNASPIKEFEVEDVNQNLIFNKDDTPLNDNGDQSELHQNVFSRYQDFDLQSPTPAMPKKLFTLSTKTSNHYTKDLDSDTCLSSPCNHFNNSTTTANINVNTIDDPNTAVKKSSTVVSSTPKLTDIFSSPTPSPTSTQTPLALNVSDNEITNFVTLCTSAEDLLESPSSNSLDNQSQPLSSSPIPSSPLASFSNIKMSSISTISSSSTSFSDFKINSRTDFTLDYLKEQIDNSILSPTPSSSQVLRRTKSMIAGCPSYYQNSSRPKEDIKNKDGFILLSPTPIAPRRRKALFSTSSVDSVASTSKVKDLKEEEEDDDKNHDTKPKDDSNSDSPSSPSSTESNSFSKCFPKRICRTYSECSLKYLRNWKDASSFGHGENSILPYDSGKDSLRRITAETLSHLLQGKYKGLYDEFHIIDCRFPYEYEGGHICNAKNVNDPATLYKLFFNKEDYSKKVIIVFHCEFSSERAPWMAQFFRKADREKNRFFYPRLHYPDVYVLKGGYKEFYHQYKEFCSPQKYVEMADAKYIEQCKQHRKMFKKAKSTSELYYSSKYQHQEDDDDSSTVAASSSFTDTNDNTNI